MTATAGTHSVTATQTATKTGAAQVWTGWAIVRTSEMPYIHFWIDGGSVLNRARAIFQVWDWSLFALGLAGTFTSATADAIKFGNGLALIWVTATTGTETSAIRLIFCPSTSSACTNGTYDSDEYLETLHAQLEQINLLKSPILTTSAAVTVPGELFSCLPPVAYYDTISLSLRRSLYGLPLPCIRGTCSEWTTIRERPDWRAALFGWPQHSVRRRRQRHGEHRGCYRPSRSGGGILPRHEVRGERLCLCNQRRRCRP